MIKIYESDYHYTIRGETYCQNAWFIEYGDKRSQPLTWHEAVGMMNQVMMLGQKGAPVHWEQSPEKYTMGRTTQA